MTDFHEQHPTPESLNDDGCKNLVAAILIQAAIDYQNRYEFLKAYPQHRSLTSDELYRFVHGNWFNTLTSINPDEFESTIQQWSEHGKSINRAVGQWRAINHRFGDKRRSNNSDRLQYEPQMLRNLLNDPRYSANWETKRHFAKPATYERKEQI